MEQQAPFYRQYLKEELKRRTERNPRYSLRAFATALEINAGTLSRILSGKQIISRNLAKKLAGMLELGTQEHEQFLYSVFKDQWMKETTTGSLNSVQSF